MTQSVNNLNDVSNPQTLDLDFERKLLASKLVSEVHRSPNHVSVTLTGNGVLAFIKALQTFAIEEGTNLQMEQKNDCGLFPEQNKDMVSKKSVITGLGVSHTTLWKWEQRGFLVPVRVGKKIYYRRSDIEKLTK
ncbi:MULTISPECIES: helix-turn-helix domain-containing protein [Prevotellaceae]|uniref:MerR HTH family regulatory protein n=1 Tax=Xylanibacter ruminicola TaxID=839 RepID=A0A1M6UGN2_XYLRU|nr:MULTISPECIES: helix-turn-helix domain-containing protein [Prevotellaceae]QVJ81948.1 helix-turn-helix domain-containing protein [Xylanibacter ruminicola]SDQ78957.1 MerR HTH family regulatory protein [Prevotella sp. khp1]SHK68415.1 MerR HTH family regulatory protein [Xylanibacter ruminicola]